LGNSAPTVELEPNVAGVSSSLPDIERKLLQFSLLTLVIEDSLL
jgi:hypothetical protein